MLKPSVPYSPLSDLPVVPPFYMEAKPSFTELDVNKEENSVSYANAPASFNLFSPKKAVQTRQLIATSNVPIPDAGTLYYFEMTIENPGRECIIGIGLVPVNHPCIGMPGWDNGSYGYHADDGKIFSKKTGGYGALFGPTYTKSDTVGLGLDQENGVIFLTLNGKLLGVPFHGVSGKFKPCVGLGTPGAKVSVNFGVTPFVYQWKEYATEYLNGKKKKIKSGKKKAIVGEVSQQEMT